MESGSEVSLEKQNSGCIIQDIAFAMSNLEGFSLQTQKAFLKPRKLKADKRENILEQEYVKLSNREGWKFVGRAKGHDKKPDLDEVTSGSITMKSIINFACKQLCCFTLYMRQEI